MYNNSYNNSDSFTVQITLQIKVYHGFPFHWSTPIHNTEGWWSFEIEVWASIYRVKTHSQCHGKFCLMFVATSQWPTFSAEFIHHLVHLLLFITILCRHHSTLLRKATIFFPFLKLYLKIARLLMCPLDLHHEGGCWTAGKQAGAATNYCSLRQLWLSKWSSGLIP